MEHDLTGGGIMYHHGVAIAIQDTHTGDQASDTVWPIMATLGKFAVRQTAARFDQGTEPLENLVNISPG